MLLSVALAMIYVYQIATAPEYYWLDTVGRCLRSVCSWKT